MPPSPWIGSTRKPAVCSSISASAPARSLNSAYQIAAYGAAAKGNTFLNVCGVHAGDIVEVYDRAASKQGKLLPGTHVPIVAPERMAVTRPDYLLVLPWNIVDEVRRTMRHIGEWGGKFVVAVPEIRVLDP